MDVGTKWEVHVATRETRYKWLRFVATLLDVIGVLLIVGSVFELLFPLSNDRTFTNIALGAALLTFVAGGIVLGGAQAIKAVADIADNSHCLPELLERLSPQQSATAISSAPSVPEEEAPDVVFPSDPAPMPVVRSTAGPTTRPCPKCGTQVLATRPICLQCGTRVLFSRPAPK
jgi:hypothetical protein